MDRTTRASWRDLKCLVQRVLLPIRAKRFKTGCEEIS